VIKPLFRNWRATVRPEGGPVAASAGPEDFTAALVTALPGLRRHAIALAGDVSRADDLIQDCIERALRNRATLKDPQRLFGWLRSILYNIYVDELRVRRRRGTPADIDEVVNSLAQSAPSADRSSMLEFARAMALLSPEHRQILLLVGLEGLSYRETAEELALPIGTVMSRLARARDQLRAALDQTEDARPPQALRAAGGLGS
jgi:RNA polymerase sigma factor (sigma-70 family)